MRGDEVMERELQPSVRLVTSRSARAADTISRSVAAALLAVSSLLWSVVVHPFAIERADASFADKQYQFEMVATLDASIDSVWAVLRDYEHYPELDPRILESRVLERPEADIVMLQTTLRMCFGPFCRNVKRVERVEETQDALHAEADPARSDVRSGETHTTLEAADEYKTRVTYRTAIAPGFWIPPFVGRRWMLNKLRDASVELFERVEQRAQGTVSEGAAAARVED